MFNLTHDESSAIDVGGVWTGPDEFELHFRFNQDDEGDVQIHLILTTEEVEMFAGYLQSRLAIKRLGKM